MTAWKPRGTGWKRRVSVAGRGGSETRIPPLRTRLLYRWRDPCSGSQNRLLASRQIVERRARVRRGRRGDERLAPALRQAERLRVPGIELAQVAPGALDAQVLLAAVDHPAQLLHDLVRRHRISAQAEQPLEPPGVAERPAGDHHRRRPGLLPGLDDRLVVAHPTGQDDRRT